MSLKSIVKNGIGSISSKRWLCRSKSHVALDVTPIEPIQQGQWENLPPELLLDIIRRVEVSETSWPASAVVIYCASVCKSWRSVTKEIIKNLQLCGKITFPISLKQFCVATEFVRCENMSSKNWGHESKQCFCRSKSHLNWDAVDDVSNLNPHLRQQVQWETLPPDLLLDIIRRVEESETFWPARAAVVYCASVCKSWRSVTKEIIKNLQQCGKITFPISLKQPGPRDHLMQCYIKRNRRTSTFKLYLCLWPSANKSRKLLLAAKWKRWFEFAISLAADDFSQAKCVGTLRSNFWGTKFTIHDTQPPHDAAVQPNCRSSDRFNSKTVSPNIPACSHLVSTISYDWRTITPRRVHCVMNSIPVSAIQEGGNAPTPTSLPQIFDEPFPMTDSYSTGRLSEQPELSQAAVEPLILKNKAARWDDWCKSWCLDYMGRDIKSSGRNFQLVADVDSSHNVSLAEQERVILNFGKVGKDIFVMEYAYPLSAFQAFSICLTSFICNMYQSKCKA